jgi:hypothetical protein
MKFWMESFSAINEFPVKSMEWMDFDLAFGHPELNLLAK